MKLRLVRVLDFEGIRRPLELKPKGGLVLIHGPNASGKSSLCRSLQAVLWPKKTRGRVDVVFEGEDGEKLEARLDGGVVQWRSQGRAIECPPLPPPEYGACYFLGIRSLLDDRGGDDQALAAAVRRQMAGGVDLVKLLRSKQFSARPTLVARKRKDAESLRRKSLDVEKELQALARKEDGLVVLRRELAGLEREGERLSLYKKACRRVELLELRDGIQKRLEAIPEATRFLQGDELKRLERLERDLRAAQERLKKGDEDRADACRRMEENALPEDALVDGVLPSLKGKAIRVVELEGELRDSQKEWTAQEAWFRNQVEAWGGVGDDWVVRGAELLKVLEGETSRLEEILVAHQRICEEDADLGIQMRRCEQQKQKLLGRENKIPLDAERIRRGLAELERLLTWSRLNPWTLLLVVGGQAALQFFYPPWGGLGFGGLVALLFVLDRKLKLRKFQGRAFGLNLSKKPLEAFYQLQLELRRRERWEELQRVLEDLELREEALRNRAEKLEGDVRALREVIGLKPAVGVLGLFDWGRRLVAMREGEGKLRLARERMEASAGIFEEERDVLVRQIEKFLGKTLEPSLGGEEYLAWVERIVETSEALKRAKGDLVQADARRGEAKDTCERLRKDIEELYAGAGLLVDHRAALEKAAEFLEDYRREKKKLDGIEGELGEIEKALAEEPRLKTRDLELAKQWVKQAMEANRQAGELHERIGRVQGEIEKTKADQKLAQAMDAWEVARGEWVEAGEEEVSRALARGILASVLEESVAQVETPVFRCAQDLFCKFTRGRFELHLRPADGGVEGDAFFALDREEGVSRSLSELSDGTRSQLLLAARIAFATVEERGISLPLFLDEALSHADDSRHEAILEALFALVQEGRQVFLLTADEADVSRVNDWARENSMQEAFQLIDLQKHMGVPSQGEPAYRLPRRPRIPSPEGMTPSAYAALLGIPAVKLFDPPGSLHLYYLLFDDLPLLHHLLLKGYTTAAQIPSLPKGDTLVLKARGALWFRFWDLWGKNRPRPLTPQVLRESPLKSSTYLTKVLPLVPESGFFFSDLQKELDDLPGFRRKTRKDLDAWAMAQGYLFADPPLTEDEILQNLLRDLSAFSPLSLDDCHAMVQMFLVGFNSICS